MMTNPNPAAKNVSPEPSDLIGASNGNSNTVSLQAPIQQIQALHGPVAILWDIENCPVPSDVRPEDVAGNIRMALRLHPVIKGVVVTFSAYGDFNSIPRRLREGFQRTGVKLIDVPNGRKDAADKAILVDMFLFALDNRPPSSILLISGDVDFAPALHILGQRGYTVILVIPAGVGVSSALSNAGRFVWDWPSVARGEGFLLPKALMPCGPDIGTGYAPGCRFGDTQDPQNEEEAIVYKGIAQSEYAAWSNTNQIYCFNSTQVSRDFSGTSQSLAEYSSNFVTMPCFPSSRSRSFPLGLNEATGEHNEGQDRAWWVQPGDVQGLKGQIVRLLELSGGSLPLVRVPSDYYKMFGRPLYVTEYGACKLVNLLKKMADVLNVEGKGTRKFVCLLPPVDKADKVVPGMGRKDRKGKGVQEEPVNGLIGCIDSVCDWDAFLDDGRGNCQDESDKGSASDLVNEIEHLKGFKQELQELLVSHNCRIPFDIFEVLYEQRYKKDLDYQSFGLEELEELLDKVRDVVVLYEDQKSEKKILVAR